MEFGHTTVTTTTRLRNNSLLFFRINWFPFYIWLVVIILRSSYKHNLKDESSTCKSSPLPSNLSTSGSAARAPVCSARATLVTSISREVARERQAKGNARARARAFPTPVTALPLASTISQGSNRLSCNGDPARRLLFSKFTSELRDLKIRQRPRQRERQKAIGLITKTTIFQVNSSLFFVHFSAVAARLRHENA